MRCLRFLLVVLVPVCWSPISGMADISVTWLAEPIHMQTLEPKTVDLDLDANGTVDFVLRSTYGTFDILSQAGNDILAWTYPPPDYGSQVIQLQAGEAIDGSASPGWTNVPGLFSSVMESGAIGLWLPPDATGYFGVRLEIGGNDHYGWVYLDNSWAGLGGGDIYGWAYETTPNTSILAGAIPEPTSLLLLGVGSLVVLTRIQKKNREQLASHFRRGQVSPHIVTKQN